MQLRLQELVQVKVQLLLPEVAAEKRVENHSCFKLGLFCLGNDKSEFLTLELDQVLETEGPPVATCCMRSVLHTVKEHSQLNEPGLKLWTRMRSG